MKWIYSIKHKSTAAMLLAFVLGIVIWNNYRESNSFSKLNKSFVSIYEDRLLVESYIFQLSKNFHQFIHEIENAQTSHSTTEFKEKIVGLENTINNLLVLYRETELTEKEEVLFASLLVEVEQINASESSSNYIACKENVYAALETLTHLSDIQIVEGARIKEESNKIFLGNKSNSQFEMVVLIVIALLIQALIFSSHTINTKIKQQYNLN